MIYELFFTGIKKVKFESRNALVVQRAAVLDPHRCPTVLEFAPALPRCEEGITVSSVSPKWHATAVYQLLRTNVLIRFLLNSWNTRQSASYLHERQKNKTVLEQLVFPPAVHYSFWISLTTAFAFGVPKASTG